MTNRMLADSLGIALLLVLGGCKNSQALPVEVASLRENLPTLERAALAWRPDAYLESSEIPLHNGSPASWLIDAHFNSPTTPYESLLVNLNIDGSISTERIAHTIPVRLVAPIAPDEWALDSEEALKSGLDSRRRQFLEVHADSHCSFLKLERDIGEPGEKVVWRLVLRECLPGGESLPDIIIDPNSGRILR